MSRACGDCRACCTTHGVPQKINKPAFTSCVHECATGCAIYPKRPGPCRAFRCLWLDGLLDDEDRPDRSGLVLTEGKSLPLGGGPLLVAHALKPGAHETESGKRVVEKVHKRGRSLIVVSSLAGERKFLAVSERAALVIQEMLHGRR